MSSLFRRSQQVSQQVSYLSLRALFILFLKKSY